MISAKVLGAYAAVGTLSPEEQAGWYRKAAAEWGLNTFEIPILGGVAVAPELVDAFVESSSSLVVTCVAQWATKGQSNPAYGLSSVDEVVRREAMLDLQSILQQCLALSRLGVTIRNVAVHTGQRTGSTIAHAIAFHKSLSELSQALAGVLPGTELSVEVADNLPSDHAIPFPAAKKSSLSLNDLLETVAAVNANTDRKRLSVMLNWGRLLINGDPPLEVIDTVAQSEVPLGGVIMSGAGATENGFADSHNSHLDPKSGFTETDGRECAAALAASSESAFLGMKCSTATPDGALEVEEVLAAEADLLNSV